MTDAPPEEIDRARALMTCLPGLVYVARARVDRPLVHVSDGAGELTGYSYPTMEGRASLSALIHPGDRDRVDREVERVTAEGSRLDIQYRIVRNDGTERWVWDRGSVADTDAG